MTRIHPVNAARVLVGQQQQLGLWAKQELYSENRVGSSSDLLCRMWRWPANVSVCLCLHVVLLLSDTFCWYQPTKDIQPYCLHNIAKVQRWGSRGAWRAGWAGARNKYFVQNALFLLLVLTLHGWLGGNTKLSGWKSWNTKKMAEYFGSFWRATSLPTKR